MAHALSISSYISHTLNGHPALPRARDVWLDMIRNARERLDIEQFYLSNWPGEPLEDVLRAIGDAARRGVRVRLLLDARMHATYPEPADSLGRLPGIEVRTLAMGPIAGGVQHAKSFLVDGEAVFLGSQNLDWRALKHIHELGVLVRDARVAGEFQRVFEMDWAAASPAGSPADTTLALRPVQVARARGELPYRIVQAPGDTLALWPSYSPRGAIPDSNLWDRDLIVRTLDGARQEVVLQTLSYIPLAICNLERAELHSSSHLTAQSQRCDWLTVNLKSWAASIASSDAPARKPRPVCPACRITRGLDKQSCSRESAVFSPSTCPSTWVRRIP